MTEPAQPKTKRRYQPKGSPVIITMDLTTGETVKFATYDPVRKRRIINALNRIHDLQIASKCTWDLTDREKRFFHDICDGLERRARMAQWERIERAGEVARAGLRADVPGVPDSVPTP